MATNKLSLYNGALRILGERKLASLTEDREPRRLLDDAWDGETAVKFCLEQGLWKFAMVAAQIPNSPSVTPSFGYNFAIEHPDDFVRTAYFCSDEFFKFPITDYIDVGQFWYVNYDNVFVQYVSNATTAGLDYSLWPESFTKYVETYLANDIAPRLTESQTKLEKIERMLRDSLILARSRDAMEGPTKELPSGTWVQSRGYTIGTRRFTGNIY